MLAFPEETAERLNILAVGFLVFFALANVYLQSSITFFGAYCALNSAPAGEFNIIYKLLKENAATRRAE